MTAPDYDANGTNIVDGTTSSTVLSTDGITLGANTMLGTNSTNTVGTINLTGGMGSISLSAYQHQPICVVSAQDASSALAISSQVSFVLGVGYSLKVFAPTSGVSKVSYICLGNPN